MKRTRAHHILLLAALLHLFADVATVGGAVLCVGPNDHQAIEVGHFGPGCDAPGAVASPSSAPAIASGADDCSECTDTALHGDAEIGSKSVTWDPTPPDAVATAFQALSPLALLVERRARATRLDLSMTMRAHRSIVLII